MTFLLESIVGSLCCWALFSALMLRSGAMLRDRILWRRSETETFAAGVVFGVALCVLVWACNEMENSIELGLYRYWGFVQAFPADSWTTFTPFALRSLAEQAFGVAPFLGLAVAVLLIRSGLRRLQRPAEPDADEASGRTD
ncbi:MAG: hypothetical protein NTW86_04615 [Candidatus Sumerlaeota bacterium]|nr:hypothetical protein [Candidatus Sumerlaeota bacterium]